MPDQLFEEPPPKRTRRKTPVHTVNEHWTPSQDDWVGLRGKFSTVDHEIELAKFLDYHLAKGSRFASWVAAYRTWCRNSIKFGTYPDPDEAEARSRAAHPSMGGDQEDFLRDNGLI